MHRATALYDGNCSLCIYAKNALARLDIFQKIEFLDFRDPAVISRFPNVNPTAAHAEIHVVTRTGKIYRGFDGIRFMARFIPPFWPILPLLYLPGARWLGSRVYEWLARHRFIFG